MLESGKSGVIAFLESIDPTRMRIVLEDCIKKGDDTAWQRVVLFTHFDWDLTTLRNVALSQADFAAIGVALVCRLLALEGIGPIEDGSTRDP